MPFLGVAIQSILDQTFRDFELLVIDDGSTDSTAAFLATQTDERLRVITQPNRGLVASLNRGIAEARYPWIARMDADDIALPGRLEQQVAFLENHPEVGVVSCAFGYVGVAGERLPITHVPRLATPPFYDPMRDPVILHQGAILDRHAVEVVGRYRDIRAAEDLDLWLRLQESRCRMASMADVLMLVRVLPSGVSSTAFVDQRIGWKYSRACAIARRRGEPEPDAESFRRVHWPRGWKRLSVAAARQFRIAGARWGSGDYLGAALALLLVLLVRPGYVLSKLAAYSFRDR